MGSKVPTAPPEKKNGCHVRLPVLPPQPTQRGSVTSANILKAENAIAMLSAIKPGTKVWLGPKQEIEATVLEVIIKGDGYMQYRLAWWSGNDRKTEWLEESEISTASAAMKVQLGFGGVA